MKAVSSGLCGGERRSEEGKQSNYPHCTAKILVPFQLLLLPPPPDLPSFT